MAAYFLWAFLSLFRFENFHQVHKLRQHFSLGLRSGLIRGWAQPVFKDLALRYLPLREDGLAEPAWASAGRPSPPGETLSLWI